VRNGVCIWYCGRAGPVRGCLCVNRTGFFFGGGGIGGGACNTSLNERGWEGDCEARVARVVSRCVKRRMVGIVIIWVGARGKCKGVEEETERVTKTQNGGEGGGKSEMRMTTNKESDHPKTEEPILHMLT